MRKKKKTTVSVPIDYHEIFKMFINILETNHRKKKENFPLFPGRKISTLLLALSR